MATKLKALLFLLWLSTQQLTAQGTAFNYQGRLVQGDNLATGLFDFQFTVFDNVINGSPTGNRVERLAVPVTNGLFTVVLDFGSGVFSGSARWLEIAVKNSFTDDLPSREIRPETIPTLPLVGAV